MPTVSPRFNVMRMVGEYADRFYAPAAAQGRRYAGDSYAPARAVANWKAHVQGAWPGVRLRRLDTPRRRLGFGDAIHIEVTGGLTEGQSVLEKPEKTL